VILFFTRKTTWVCLIKNSIQTWSKTHIQKNNEQKINFDLPLTVFMALTKYFTAYTSNQKEALLPPDVIAN